MLTRTWQWTAAPGCRVTVTNPTDAELVESCLTGHREAFDVLVERHQRHVYQRCYRFVGNHEDASDLAQDVFIARIGAETFKGQASLGTWHSDRRQRLPQQGQRQNTETGSARSAAAEERRPDRVAGRKRDGHDAAGERACACAPRSRSCRRNSAQR
jgi:hypothetical protein